MHCGAGCLPALSPAEEARVNNSRHTSATHRSRFNKALTRGQYMKIIGISGLEGSVPFKQKHWPGLDEREYRISQGHDSAAALVIDGEVIAAAAEERFNRRKHSGAFPIGAINYCLAEAGVTIDEIDELAHGFDYSPYQKFYSLDPI